MTVLVDTNVLLDFLQRRLPHDAAAAEVWRLAHAGRVAGHVSAISFNNIFYIAEKQIGVAAAMTAVLEVRKVFQVVALDAAIIDAAIATGASDLEGAIQAVSALRVSADYLVTRNVRDFATLGVRAVMPIDFLSIVTP